MSRELVCADGELSAALNKTERYIEFLDECIREYNKILSEQISGSTTCWSARNLHGFQDRCQR